MDPIWRFPIVTPGRIPPRTLDDCLFASEGPRLVNELGDVVVELENWARLNGGKVTSLPPVARLMRSMAFSIGLMNIRPIVQAKLSVKDWYTLG
jgi:hypothetical protein